MNPEPYPICHFSSVGDPRKVWVGYALFGVVLVLLMMAHHDVSLRPRDWMVIAAVAVLLSLSLLWPQRSLRVTSRYIKSHPDEKIFYWREIQKLRVEENEIVITDTDGRRQALKTHWLLPHPRIQLYRTILRYFEAIQKMGYQPDPPVEWSIETDRLVLRPWRADELALFSEFRSAPEITESQLSDPLGEWELRTLLESEKAGFAARNFIELAVELKSTGEIVSAVSLHYKDPVLRQCDIGFNTLAIHAGHGYATEAVDALRQDALSTLGMQRIDGGTFAENTAAARVFEKAGFREVGGSERFWIRRGAWKKSRHFSTQTE